MELNKKIEFRNPLIRGHLNDVYSTLNKIVSAYKGIYDAKIGITGRSPQDRYNEHLKYKERDWKRMVILYITSSENYANTLEKWLIENHKYDLVNARDGGGSHLSKDGPNYIYILLAEKTI